MYRSDVRARLEGGLDPRPSPIAGPGTRLAAVLLPLVDDDRLVLTRLLARTICALAFVASRCS